MKCDRQTLVKKLRQLLIGNESWSEKLCAEKFDRFGLHVAILREPYLRFIMEGKKKIETRFAKRACPPFERVLDGDVLVLKKAGGEVVGVCEVEKVWFYRLDPDSLETIKRRFEKLICPADGNFWKERQVKTVATLMLVANVAPVTGFKIDKRDRRGWVTFDADRQAKLFQA